MRTMLAIIFISVVFVTTQAQAQNQIQVELDLPGAGAFSVGIYDGEGRLVRTLADAHAFDAGKQSLVWDMRDYNGDPVEAGSYQWRAADGSSLKAAYLATVANGRSPQAPNDMGNVEGMALFEIKVDEDGTIYTSGSGHGKSVQKISPDGIVGKPATNVSAVEVVSSIALDSQYVYAVGDKGFYRINKQTMVRTPWPHGDLVVYFEQQPNWYPAGDKWAQYDVLRKEADESFQPDGSNDPRMHGWRGIMRHPQWFYEGERIRGATVWNDRLLISDSHYDQVHVYDTATGKHITSWDGFVDPNGIVVRNKSEAFIIADGKVKAIDQDGKIRRDVVVDHLVRPAGLAIGRHNRIYVTDLGIPNQVKVFTPSGKLIETFGESGPINGTVSHDKLWIPRGIAVDKEGDIILSEFGINRVQKLTSDFKPIWDLQAFYCYLGTHDQSDPQWLYGYEGPMFPVVKQFNIDYESGQWQLTRAWYMHWFNDASSFYGYPSCGGGAVTLDGQKFVFVNHKTLRIYRLDGDHLIPVVRIGPRVSYTRADGSRADYMRGTASTWSMWQDNNQDRLVTEDEVSILPGEQAAAAGYDIYGEDDVEIGDDGTIYMGNMAFALQGVKDGIPQYSWDAVSMMNVSTPQRPVQSRGISGTAIDDQGNRYYGIKEHSTGRGDFGGLTFWAKRVGWQHVVKYSPDGQLLWRTGRKAYGHVQPGEFSYMTSVDWADGLVYVGDMDGYTHVFTDDGLFLTRFFRGFREGADHTKDIDAITSHELGHVEAYHNDKDGHSYVLGQSLEGGEHIRVYRVMGSDQIVRAAGHFSVHAANLEGVESMPVLPVKIKGQTGLQTVSITSVLEPPAVDGSLSDWNQLVSPFEIKTDDGATVVRVIMRYDEKYLYIGAECKGDDSPARNAYYPKEIGQTWKGDCVNLFINTDPKVDRDRALHLPDDFHLLFPLDGKQAGLPLQPYAFKQKKFIEDAEYRLVVHNGNEQAKDKGWSMTARIPWRALGDYLPVPNDKLHLDVQVDFGNADGSAYFYSMSLGGSLRSFTNPSLWNGEGTLIYAR